MSIRRDKPTFITLLVLLSLIAVAVVDFIRAIMKGGFMSYVGVIAIIACAPTMFLLAYFLGNHDVKPTLRQRNRDRFLDK